MTSQVGAVGAVGAIAVAVAAVAVAVAGVAVSVVMVARPSTGEVDRVDGVVVHAASARRLEAALGVAGASGAQGLLISDTGSDYGQPPGAVARLCERTEPFEVVCVPPPAPGNTLAEARAVGEAIAERGWERVAVVTSRAHLRRAATAVRQCTDAEVVPVAADPGAEASMRQVRAEWIRAVATATVVRAC